MEYLRWILLLSGLVVLVVVYFLSRAQRRGAVESVPLFAEPEAEAYSFGNDFDAQDFDQQNFDKVASVDISESDANIHVLSNLSHELETLNQLLGRKEQGAESAAEKLAPDLNPHYIEELAHPSLSDEPFFGDLPVLGDLFEEGQTEEPSLTAAQQAEKIIILHICAREGAYLDGRDLLRIFNERGYEFGEMDIYHSRFDGTTVFSVVNMVEPGWFTPSSMDTFTTPGISLFMCLPSPLSAGVAFDMLVNEARELALELSARLLDSSRSTLTLQMEQHLREEVKHYDFERKRDGI